MDMDKLEGACIVYLYHYYATSHPLSKLSMWSHLRTMSAHPTTNCYIRHRIKI